MDAHCGLIAVKAIKALLDAELKDVQVPTFLQAVTAMVMLKASSDKELTFR
jgi:hypothetical protein